MKSLLFQQSPNLIITITVLSIILATYKDYTLVLASYLFILLILYWMYRNPDRDLTPKSPNYIYSPADSKVTFIKETDEYYLISTFLSPKDVHVQYIPYKSTVLYTNHIKGPKFPAFLEKSRRNERMITSLQSDIGTIKVVQIAGILLQRVVSFVNKGDHLKTGNRLGMIKFGSRVDIYIPKNRVKILVKKGDQIIGGVTKIAKVKK